MLLAIFAAVALVVRVFAVSTAPHTSTSSILYACPGPTMSDPKPGLGDAIFLLKQLTGRMGRVLGSDPSLATSPLLEALRGLLPVLREAIGRANGVKHKPLEKTIALATPANPADAATVSGCIELASAMLGVVVDAEEFAVAFAMTNVLRHLAAMSTFDNASGASKKADSRTSAGKSSGKGSGGGTIDSSGDTVMAGAATSSSSSGSLSKGTSGDGGAVEKKSKPKGASHSDVSSLKHTSTSSTSSSSTAAKAATTTTTTTSSGTKEKDKLKEKEGGASSSNSTSGGSGGKGVGASVEKAAVTTTTTTAATATATTTATAASSSGGAMKIRISTPTVDIMSKVTSNTTVLRVRQAVHSQTCLELSTIRLMLNGVVLLDEQTMGEVGVKEGDELAVYVPPVDSHTSEGGVLSGGAE